MATESVLWAKSGPMVNNRSLTFFIMAFRIWASNIPNATNVCVAFQFWAENVPAVHSTLKHGLIKSVFLQPNWDIDEAR